MAMRINLSTLIIVVLTPFLGASTCTTEGSSHNLKFTLLDCGNPCLASHCGGFCPFNRPLVLHGTISVQITHLDDTPADDVELDSTNAVMVTSTTNSNGHKVFTLYGSNITPDKAVLAAHSPNGDNDTLVISVHSPDNLQFVDTNFNSTATDSFPMNTMNVQHWDISADNGSGTVNFQLVPFLGNNQQLMGKLQYHRTGAALPGETTMLSSTDGYLAASLTRNNYEVHYTLNDPATITFDATITVH